MNSRQSCRICRSRSDAAGHCRAGFTIVELLAAMTILMVIVTVFARFFQRSTQSWESGMRTVEMTIAGRAAMNLMVRDIERAMADDVLAQEIVKDGVAAFRVAAGSLQLIAPAAREPFRAQRIAYRVSGGQLLRSVGGTENPVIDNVAGISFVPAFASDGMPEQVGIRLRLSSRYDAMTSREQEFVGRAFPAHHRRYPDAEE